jgi:acyl-coenzyme A thioesterase PaaI-like protein
LQLSQKRLESLARAEHPRCMACSPANPSGLNLVFTVRRDGSVAASFSCQRILQGYPEALHGGVISALLDAAMTNALFAAGVVALTAELVVRFIEPVRLDRQALVRGRIVKACARRLYELESELEQDGRCVAQATAKFLPRRCTPTHAPG